MIYNVTLHLDKYTGHPFWPEANDVVTIETKSGVNRARSEDKRKQALDAYLNKIGMSVEEFMALQQKAKRPWYRIDNDDPNSEIVVPRHHLAGMLVQGCKTAPAGARLDAGNLRSQVMLGDLTTGKYQADEVFRRYVKNEKTNMRRLQENDVIRDFQAVGQFDLSAAIDEQQFTDLLKHCLRYVGIGAARKMGYGRGRLVTFEAVGELAEV